MRLPIAEAPSRTLASLRRRLEGARYDAYTYSYPHKTAYRPFDEPLPLERLWADEDRSALFLYMHVPFCEMRCGFCNLFTTANPQDALRGRYVATLETQAQEVCGALGEARFARVAFGGGTPTFLTPAQLARLFDVAEERFGASLAALPTSLETSPRTATPAHLALARERGVDRISIGVQSFIDAELQALGRPSTRHMAREALERIRSFGFPTLNIDLIYGVPGQTRASFDESLDITLAHEPREVFLYPLYVRPLTGLGRRGAQPDDRRPELYEHGRARLLDAGFEQRSLRLFQRAGGVRGPAYRCQEDGMVGLGCGARSYTRSVHYSDDWAVSRAGVKGILEEWVERPAESFRAAHHGIRLDAEEQRRRYLIQSLTHAEGLDRGAWSRRFGTDVEADFPELADLFEEMLVRREEDRIVPTARGFAWADSIGPWLYSDAVRRRMGGFELR